MSSVDRGALNTVAPPPGRERAALETPARNNTERLVLIRHLYRTLGHTKEGTPAYDDLVENIKREAKAFMAANSAPTK